MNYKGTVRLRTGGVGSASAGFHEPTDVGLCTPLQGLKIRNHLHERGTTPQRPHSRKTN